MQKQAILIGFGSRLNNSPLRGMGRIIHRRIFQLSCGMLLIVTLVGSLLWSTSKALVIPSSKLSIPTNNGEKTSNAGSQEILTYFDDSTDLSTLKLAQVIFRHGARTPLYPFPTDPNKDFDYGGVKGTGQLLAKGKKQAFAFGKYLRKRYDGYLDSSYAYDQVYTQSSDTDRTIMTAQSCLEGLFSASLEGKEGIRPGTDWEPIPVHSLPKRIDNKISFDHPCKLHAELYAEYLVSPPINEFNKEHERIYEVATVNSGENITDFRKLEKLSDTLLVEKQNGLVLPDWAEDLYPQTLPAFRLDFTAESATPPLQRLLISPLVTEMLFNMEFQMRKSASIPPSLLSISAPSVDLSDYHNRSAKVYLYSGHDTTLSGYLNCFDVYDGEPPTYVSAIIIELHHEPNNTPPGLNEIENNEGEDSEEYVIKIFYKKEVDEPIRELNLPKCPNPCRISSFRTNYAEFLMDYTQWNRACS